MKYTSNEVLQYVSEEDVKFIRLAFCDVFGRQKNVSVMPGELQRAFSEGILIDGSAVKGFIGDVFLHPDPETLSLLPWRPEHGCVVRMFCTLTDVANKAPAGDTRSILKAAAQAAKDAGIDVKIGSKQEFYLFSEDENGMPTGIPYDKAGYMDIAPDDKGENVRREICLTLEQMGITPKSSHHEKGPGQNTVAISATDPLRAADDAMTFRTVVSTTARRNGLFADFSPKPDDNNPGNGFFLKFIFDTEEQAKSAAAGIMERLNECSAFTNPTNRSFARLKSDVRGLLIRLFENQKNALEVRLPDPSANPYIVYALLLKAACEGIKENKKTGSFMTLIPDNHASAKFHASISEFIKENLPEDVIKLYSD